ncbi:MAG TPA: hypothetical protein VF791_23970 [Pyrinomonadaceae bacterium]
MKKAKLLMVLCSWMFLALPACKDSRPRTGNETSHRTAGGAEKSSGGAGSIEQLEPFGGCNTGDAEDREWCARYQIGRMGTQPPHVPVGEIPADPNVSRIFDSPVVFVSTQLYVWFSSQTYTIEGYGGEFRNQQSFYFLPTGRYFYKSVRYEGQTTPEGQVAVNWGSYRFTGNEEIEVESDEGERISMQLKLGRRNLIWGNTTFGEVDWEREALRRQTGQ